MALGEVDGKHYGIPTNINLKSMIWYPKDDFDEAGYKVPDDVGRADGPVATRSWPTAGTPWCVGFESGGATGWPATDWMEDIMLRTAGPDTYDQWYKHEIPFNDPAVVTAATDFGDVMFHHGYVLGGAEKHPGRRLRRRARCRCSTTRRVLAAPAGELHQRLLPGGHRGGRGLRLVPIPPHRQEGILFGGEMAVVFRQRARGDGLPRTSSSAEDFQCAMGGSTASSRISPNVNVGRDCYANEILADSSAVLTEALRPAPAGSTPRT